MTILRDASTELRRHPRLPLTMAAVLAVGFAAAASVFTLVDALALRPVPYPHADRLVTASIGARVWSARMLEAVMGTNRAFDVMAGVHERAASLVGDGNAEVVRLEAVSPGYFDVVGVAPARGTLWTAESDTDGAAGAVAVVSDRLWRRRYGADPALVGRAIRIDGSTVRILGVLPARFAGAIGRTDVWIPLRFANSLGGRPQPERPWSRWFEVFGRIRADLTLPQAQQIFAADAVRAMETLPGSAAALGSRWRSLLVPLADARRDARAARAAEVLLAGVAFTLLLAAINLAGLQLLRTEARRRDLAIRAAMGASRGRLAATSLVETGLVVALGLAGSVLLRQSFLAALLSLRPEPVSFGLRSADVFDAAALALDWRSAAALGGAAVACWLLIAGLALLRLRKPALDGLTRGSAGQSGGLGHFGRLRTGSLLVAIEIALAVVLATGAGLMARTAAMLWSQDRSIDPAGVLTLRLQLPDYDTPSLAALYASLQQRVAALPGVESVSVSNCAPGTGRCRQTNVQRVDGRLLEPAERPTVGVHYATPGHFELLRTPIVSGRSFADRDSAGSTPVVVVSRAAAERLWPGASPLGRRLSLYFASGAGIEDREVVGVAANVRFDAIEDAAVPDVYVPAAQMPWTSAIVFVRGAGGRSPDLASVQSALAGLDARVAIADAKPLVERLGAGFATERFLETTLIAFAAAALLLAWVGVYGLASHAVAEGRRECAIRLAVGAAPRRVFALVAGRAAALVTSAAVLGTLAAAAAAKVLTAFLYGVRASDPIAFAGAAAAVILMASAAVIVPAHRAARLSPAELLRD